MITEPGVVADGPICHGLCGAQPAPSRPAAKRYVGWKEMTMPIDARLICPASELRGDDDEDTALLQTMLSEASSFLASHSWCGSIRESYFGMGIGKVVAVFLFRISPDRPEIDEWLWVVVGDLPPAYLICDDAPDPGQALQRYVEEMRRWVDAVRGNQPLDDVIPVGAAATSEHADMLASRLDFLEREIIPHAHQYGTASEQQRPPNQAL